MTVRGVGIIGAGPGASALHVPTLARLGGFAVVHVADGGGGRAAGIARPSGARSSTGVDELLADAGVEVVVVCSPPGLHAEHILVAVAAGKRAVFCEKPLALTVDDATRVIDECRAAGVALIVGTNHLYDPAWTRAQHHLIAAGARPRSISVVASLAPNPRYHAVVTEMEEAPGASRGAPDWTDPGAAAGVIRQLVLGLAIHDLPIVRDLAPEFERLVWVRPVPPIGFELAFTASGVLVRLSAVMRPEGPDSTWRMTIGTNGDRIDVDFPPPFVHAGSATASVRGLDGRRVRYARQDVDGYLAEWRAFEELLAGRRPVEYDELLADALFAIEVADAAAAAVGAGRAS